MSIQLRGRARTTRRSIISLFAGLAMLLGLVVAQGVNAPSASAVGDQAVIGMPFTGKWAYSTTVNPPYTDNNSSYPSVHDNYTADWATDVYATGGTDVRIKVNYPSSGYTLNVSSVTDTSCGAGKRVRVSIKFSGVEVGWAQYDHLDTTISNGTALNNGDSLGKTKNWGFKSCYQVSGDSGVHVHFGMKNTQANNACYEPHLVGETLTSSAALGLLGAQNSGTRQACIDLPSGGSYETRPTVSNTVPWSFTNLDGDSGSLAGQQGDIGRGAAAVEYQGSLQVFYYDATGGNLRHAWKGSSGTWNFETLDGAGGGSGRRDADLGQNPSVAVYGTSIQVFYYDATSGNLRHAFASLTSGWQFENLDGDAGSIGGQNANVGANSEVTVMNGVMHVFYPNSSSGNLRRAWHDSTGWHFHNLDGDAGSIAGQYGSYAPQVGASIAATVQGGKVQVFYYDATNDNLRHAWYNGSTWGFETLDGDAGSISGHTGSVGQNPSVAATSDGLQLFYYDASGGNLRHAWTSSTVGWQFENLDGPSSSIGPNRHAVGLYSSVHVVNGDVKVFYFDNRWTNLRQAWASPTTGWQFENLDGLGGGPAGRTHMDVGSFPFLTYFGGKWHGFYYDIYGGNLRLATPQ